MTRLVPTYGPAPMSTLEPMSTVQSFASPRISQIPRKGYHNSIGDSLTGPDGKVDFSKVLALAGQVGGTIAATIAALKAKGQIPADTTVPVQYSPNYIPPKPPDDKPKDSGNVGWWIAGGVVVVGLIITAIVVIPRLGKGK